MGSNQRMKYKQQQQKRLLGTSKIGQARDEIHEVAKNQERITKSKTNIGAVAHTMLGICTSTGHRA